MRKDKDYFENTPRSDKTERFPENRLGDKKSANRSRCWVSPRVFTNIRTTAIKETDDCIPTCLALKFHQLRYGNAHSPRTINATQPSGRFARFNLFYFYFLDVWYSTQSMPCSFIETCLVPCDIYIGIIMSFFPIDNATKCLHAILGYWRTGPLSLRLGIEGYAGAVPTVRSDVANNTRS